MKSPWARNHHPTFRLLSSPAPAGVLWNQAIYSEHMPRPNSSLTGATIKVHLASTHGRRHAGACLWSPTRLSASPWARQIFVTPLVQGSVFLSALILKPRLHAHADLALDGCGCRSPYPKQFEISPWFHRSLAMRGPRRKRTPLRANHRLFRRRRSAK
ncbi:uncharacterized protein LAESUDRAFT_758688 [Laetiporus sulphureus 93-53]|uniref:Uncharacterized protein n=1 Tax=Laetiporus sulphureus 93-53 TaxID=1314785 RepID=A0A165EL32_9APHY|nr:uncharacterized protein LAESUDRAFT_758688 [Laetiporus sulphureus 93-53]KZT07281.1 hypothetical protein LAESUDRAFT_758688 [Laetiporus sulphureus 93-53]